MTGRARDTNYWWIRGGLLAAVGVALAGGIRLAAAAEGPSLGAARTFVVLGGSSISNSGATSYFDGDVGVSPGSTISGFAASQVSGGIYVGGDPEADAAHSDAALAYAFLAGMASTTNLTGTDLGGQTLDPGVYKFNSSAGLTGQLFLDAGGDSKAVFIFQIASTLTTASGASVTVINGGADYDESKVYWQVGSSATLGSGTAFVGNILAYASISIVSGSTMTGNALALGGSVTTDSNSMASPPIQEAGIEAPVDLTAELAGSPVVPAADLTWTDASDNETEFRVYRRVGAGPDFVQIATVTSSNTAGTGDEVTYQDEGLDTMKIYAYRVTAFETTVGESAPSNEALVDTGVFLPINLTAELSGSPVVPAADLTWNDASDDETEFRVYRRDGSGAAFLLIGTVLSANTAGTGDEVTYNDPALERMMIYTYRVTAFDATSGESPPSNEALIDTGVFLPIDLTATLSGSPVVPSADLAWSDASDNETEFRVYRRDGVGPAFVQIATVFSGDTPGIGDQVTYQDAGLDSMTIYTYRVTAFDATAGESLPSNEALVDTGILVPINLTAVLNGSTETPGTDLAWTDASDDETEFRVYRMDGVDGDFVLLATVPSTDTAGTGGLVTYNDPVLDYLTTFTYRVTSVNASGDESVPSNEAMVGTTFGPPVRWLDVHLGRSRSKIRDRKRADRDVLRLRGSFSVIDVDSEVPTVMDDVNPITDGFSVQVRAPGSIYLLQIPAGDPNWKVSKKGVYRWRTHDGKGSPLSRLRIDTRRSEFTLRSRRNEFGNLPVNNIIVSLTCEGAIGSETRTWDQPGKLPGNSRAKFTLPK